MNLHEECLLKYLSNTSNLSLSTNLLKKHNNLIEKGFRNTILLGSNGINYKINKV